MLNTSGHVGTDAVVIGSGNSSIINTGSAQNNILSSNVGAIKDITSSNSQIVGAIIGQKDTQVKVNS